MSPREAPIVADRPPRELHLPVLMLSQYLFFLTRRPISRSNLHYLDSRLRGLKSLHEFLTAQDVEGLPEVLRQLDALHPAGFSRIGADLRFALLPLARAVSYLPEDLVVEERPPGPTWLDGHRRALLILAPGIGIGDELIAAALPKWLKQKNPDLRIDTLSGYREIWNRVPHVDEAQSYEDYRPIVQALRGASPYDEFDLVVLVDFESPELYRGVASDGRVPKYVEISIGSRSAFVLDNKRRWLSRVHHQVPYAENFYFGFHQVMRRLGLDPMERDRFAGILSANHPRDPGRLRIFASPFTSKYDPSQAYWSHALSLVGRAKYRRPVQIVLDAGKGASTASFAACLARSVAARVPAHVEVEVALSGDTGLPLGAVFDELARSDALVCADSFTAHAGPLLDCTSLVVARGGLENWRVPFERSFYFDGDSAAGDVGAAMSKVLREIENPPLGPGRLAQFTQAELRLDELTRELEMLLEQSDVGELRRVEELSEELSTLRGALATANANGGTNGTALFRDESFHSHAPRPRATDEELKSGSKVLLNHHRDQIERWRNTNYCKYLRSIAGAAGRNDPERP